MARTKRKVNPLQPVITTKAQKQRIYQTGAYIRLSVEDSGKPGTDTITMQQELVLNYINGQTDMELVDVYWDNGQTGTNFDRPAFERLMEDVRNGKINCIVVKDLSRFGRNYKETGNYLERIFPYLDIRFVAVTDHFDTLTAEHSEAGYIIPLKNILNELYSWDLSQKSNSALLAKRQRGEFVGATAPYGYRKCADNHNRLEPNAETAPVVQMIFQWRLSGISYSQIARKLNEQNIPAPARYRYLHGEAKSEKYAKVVWKPSTIKQILFHEAYIGHMIQGRVKMNLATGYKSRRVPKSEWIIVHNTHPAIIDEKTFHIVQEMAEACRAAHKERLGKFGHLGTIPNFFKGLIFCADCKCLMIRYKNVSPKCGHRYYTYICRTHSENPNDCPKKHLYETKLKEILWDLLQCEIQRSCNMERLVQQYDQSTGAMIRKNHLDKVTATQQTIEKAKALYTNLFQSYQDNLMTEQEYTEMREYYCTEIKQAQIRLTELEEERQAQEDQITHNPWLIAYNGFQTETELTENMVHTLIERVEVAVDGHIHVTLRYQDEYRALVQLVRGANESEAVST
ncbi:MAG: recombinase family protein [Oscillospiraceae bacterium]|nr:recombinase family protein [Oscillospiraceae bacterium]